MSIRRLVELLGVNGARTSDSPNADEDRPDPPLSLIIVSEGANG